MQRSISLFLILFGAILVALFVLSDIAKQANFTFLLVGATALIVGIFLRAANAAPPPTESQRFRMLKKIMDREKKEKEQSDKK